MDGLPQAIMPHGLPPRQRTVRSRIGCVGVGLHGGRRVAMTICPAPADHGVAFQRTDLPNAAVLPARWDRVGDTRLCTVLVDPVDTAIRVGTVEHLMAALATVGVTNAVIEIDGAECPILDGSAAPFVFLLDCAGVVEQDATVALVMPTRPVRVTQGSAFAELRPTLEAVSLDLRMSIEFDAGAIGRQSVAAIATEPMLRAEFIRARTFTLAGEIARLREAGLARGGSLENAVVVDGHRVLNPGGWRMDDECARHKLLDVVGDLALAGVALRGRFTGHCSGHALNNQLLRAVFADRGNWRTIETAAATSERGWQGAPARVAA